MFYPILEYQQIRDTVEFRTLREKAKGDNKKCIIDICLSVVHLLFLFCVFIGPSRVTYQ